MFGHQLVNYLSNTNEYNVIDISFRNKLRDRTIIVDARNKTLLENTIVDLKPDVIINCIGILTKGSRNEEDAIYINAFLPHHLKNIVRGINSKLIHISTDCVFSGYKGKYIESDKRDGDGVYSQTKILGEIVDDTNLTLRTSIIGPELKNNGEGLFHWFMNQSGDISGYTKAIWSGVTTIELAKTIKWAIDNNLTGLYHITNNTSISKYELLKLFQKYTKKEINIYPTDRNIVNKSLLDTRKIINYDIPSYEIMVKEMVENMKSNTSLYPYKNI